MFDYTYKIICDGNEVEYGCIVGNNKIVYIKAGMEGSYLVPPKSIARSEGKAVRVIDKRKLI